jgi:hypothetical protein
MDKKIIWIVLVLCLILLLWWAIDHILFPTLPMPAGTAPLTK